MFGLRQIDDLKLQAHDLGDNGSEQVRRLDRGRGDKVDAIGETIEQVGDRLQRQARLADPA
jgi:hypothetical protein